MARSSGEANKIYKNWEEAELRRTSKSEKEDEVIEKMGLIDKLAEKFRSRARISDPNAAWEEALIEKEARERIEKEKRKAAIQQKMAELKQPSAGKSPFSPTILNVAVGQVGRSRVLMIFVILMLVALVVGGIYIIKRGLVLAAILVVLKIILGLLFLIIIVWGFMDKDETSRWIAIAFIIWGIDLLPYNFFGYIFGPPYAGFEFSLNGILNTDWIRMLTSVVFLFLLFLGIVSDIIKRHWLVLPLYLAILEIINRLVAIALVSPIRYNLQIPLGNYIFLGIIVVGFVMAFKFRDRLQNTDFADLPTYLVMIFTISFFTANKKWLFGDGLFGIYWRPLFHFLYILAFGLGYMRLKEEERPSVWHLWLTAFLIADFYLYNFFWIGSSALVDGLQFAPLLVGFVLFYCYDKARTRYAFWSIFFVLMIIFVSIIPVYASESEGIEFKARRGLDFRELSNQFTDKIKQVIEGRLDIATAGLYRGNVEKNRYESLGVYFSNIRAADPRFYTDEPITVWGSIRSKTYKDAVIVNYNCYRWKDDKRIKADKIFPDIKFPIFTLEEVDTECVFFPKDKPIPTGSNTVTFSAEYNFGTDSYLKTYFMDRDRFRAYSRENIDPLTEFGIKDKTPAAVFTNGPVEVGISAGPLLTVSEGYTIKPAIGVTLSNRKEIQDKDKRVISKWDGKIKNITELIILTPPSIELKDLDSCKEKEPDKKIKCPCSMPFYKYDIQDCEATCLGVNRDCEQTCEFSYGKREDKEKCKEECNAGIEKCNNDCSLLFEEDNSKEKYNAYALDVNSIEFKDLNKDIDKHRSFMCRLDVNSKVLDNTPITTRYFRVRARYNYLLENSVTINVEALPVEVRELLPEQSAKEVLDFIKKRCDIYTCGFSQELVFAIASVESGMRHCCKEAGKNNAKCEPTTESKCEPERVIKSYDNSSIGYMQINKINANIANSVCEPGQDIYHKECNIKVGTEILNRYFKQYKDGIKPEKLAKYCPPDKQPDRYKKYLAYKGYKAALRAYNGWGCSSKIDDKCINACSSSRDKAKCEQNCVDRTINYVEKVEAAARSIKGIEIIDRSTLKSVSPTETMVEGEKGDLYEEVTYITPSQGLSPLRNVEAVYNNDGSATISWAKSTNPDTSSYRVTRYVGNEPAIIICDIKAGDSETYSCIDNTKNLEIGVTYTYSIFTYTISGYSQDKVDLPYLARITSAP